MKALKVLFTILVISLLACSLSWGQTFRVPVHVVVDNLDYGPEIGITSGSYTYMMTFNLDKDGKLGSLHWNVRDCNVTNHRGDAVRVIDTGMDNYGAAWIMWNSINAMNAGYPIYYDSQDGWLDEFMPEVMPCEGTAVALSCKILCNGKMYAIPAMVQLHMNANGEVTAEMYKGAFTW